MMTDKLLIVGGTGFIGRNLATNAIKKGLTTIVLSLNEPHIERKIPGVVYLQADITSLIQLREKLSNKTFDYVVNLSGYIDHSAFLDGGRSIIDTHFFGVQNLLQVLDWKSLKRFIQIGSSDEYGNHPAPQNEDMCETPISSYSLAKVASTKLLQMLHRTENLPAVVLRLFLVYGNGQDSKRFIPQIIKGCLLGKNFPASEGEQLRDFCHVDDITNGILESLYRSEVNGEIINLASGVSISIREIIELIQNLTGSGNPEFGKIAYRNGENMELFANIEKARKLMNWSPKIGLNEGIAKTIEFYQSTD